jgi:2-dehydro-3-deoxygluconokinase
MGETFRPFYNHLVDWLKVNPQVKLVYNPGPRQLRVPFEQIADIVGRTFILFVNREEAEGMTQMKDSFGKEKELIDALKKLGVEHPVVTDGGNGAFAWTEESYAKIGVLPVDAYERTGAGDAFGSGLLAALIRGENWETALTWGTVNSASVIGYTGAQKGLLREDEMKVWVDRSHSSNVYVEKF